MPRSIYDRCHLIHKRNISSALFVSVSKPNIIFSLFFVSVYVSSLSIFNFFLVFSLSRSHLTHTHNYFPYLSLNSHIKYLTLTPITLGLKYSLTVQGGGHFESHVLNMLTCLLNKMHPLLYRIQMMNPLLNRTQA